MYPVLLSLQNVGCQILVLQVDVFAKQIMINRMDTRTMYTVNVRGVNIVQYVINSAGLSWHSQ